MPKALSPQSLPAPQTPGSAPATQRRQRHMSLSPDSAGATLRSRARDDLDVMSARPLEQHTHAPGPQGRAIAPLSQVRLARRQSRMAFLGPAAPQLAAPAMADAPAAPVEPPPAKRRKLGLSMQSLAPLALHTYLDDGPAALLCPEFMAPPLVARTRCAVQEMAPRERESMVQDIYALCGLMHGPDAAAYAPRILSCLWDVAPADRLAAVSLCSLWATPDAALRARAHLVSRICQISPQLYAELRGVHATFVRPYPWGACQVQVLERLIAGLAPEHWRAFWQSSRPAMACLLPDADSAAAFATCLVDFQKSFLQVPNTPRLQSVDAKDGLDGLAELFGDAEEQISRIMENLEL